MRKRAPKKDRGRARALRRKYGLNNAGKGDRPRNVDEELYSLGQSIYFAETEEERAYFEEQWRQAMARKRDTP